MAFIPRRSLLVSPPGAIAAHDLAFIGWFFVLLLFLPVVILAFVVLLLPAWTLFIGFIVTNFVNSLLAAFGVAPIASLSATSVQILFGGFSIFLLIILIVSYAATVHRVNVGNYSGARSGALFFGIFLLLFGGFVLTFLAGIFFILSYSRLGEVVSRFGPVAFAPHFIGPGPPPPVPILRGGGGAPDTATVASSSPAKLEPMKGVMPRIPACPSCGKDLYYSLKHKQWYCAQCA